MYIFGSVELKSEFVRTLATKSYKEYASPMASSGDLSIDRVGGLLVRVSCVVSETFILGRQKDITLEAAPIYLLFGGIVELAPVVIGLCGTIVLHTAWLGHSTSIWKFISTESSGCLRLLTNEDQ